MKRWHESVDYIQHPSPKHSVKDVCEQFSNVRVVNSQPQHHTQFPPVPLFNQDTDESNTVELNPAISSANSSPTNQLSPNQLTIDNMALHGEFNSETVTQLFLKECKVRKSSPQVFISGYAQVKDNNSPKYTVYVVNVGFGGLRWVVYRRYNDFRDLFDSMVRNCGVNSIPQLPPKTIFANFSSEFLTKRQYDLHVWLSNSLQCCFALQIAQVRKFLSNKLNTIPFGMQPVQLDSVDHKINEFNRWATKYTLVNDRIRATSRQSSDSGSQSIGSEPSAARICHPNQEFDPKSIPAISPVRQVNASPPPPQINFSSPISNNSDFGIDRKISSGSPAIAVPVKHRPGAKKSSSLLQRMQKDQVESMQNDASGRILDTTGKVGLDDFERIRVLGKGSFGKVVLARKHNTNKLYAMKILNKQYVVMKKQVEHTKTERSVLSYMNHPFIVKLHYAFQTGDKLHFVLDFCSGGELFFHLGRAGRFTEELGRFYAAEISLALGHLHEKGVVYRDLKPENILLDQGGHIKLADFGLSKEGINSGTEGTHSFCGTPEYLAPEVLNRTGHGTSVDWWSLGALLYEMLTGLPPWYNQNRKKMFQGIRSSALRFPPFVSVVAQDLLSAFLRRDASERLGSKRGVQEVKEHPFFNPIDWEKLYNKEVQPPFVPTVESNLDTRNFETTFTRLPVDSVAHCDDIAELSRSRVESNPFDGFTFTDPSLMSNLTIGSMRRQYHVGSQLNTRRRSLAGSLSPASVFYARSPKTPSTLSTSPSSLAPSSFAPSSFNTAAAVASANVPSDHMHMAGSLE